MQSRGADVTKQPPSWRYPNSPGAIQQEGRKKRDVCVCALDHPETADNDGVLRARFYTIRFYNHQTPGSISFFFFLFISLPLRYLIHHHPWVRCARTLSGLEMK